MQEAVVCWRKKYSNKCEKSYTTEQSIKSCEQFTTIRFDMINWSHTSQNHRGIKKGI